MEALGLVFIGPQESDGMQADPWSDDVPAGGGHVPTFYIRGKSPASPTHLLDFVFAFRDMADCVCVP